MSEYFCMAGAAISQSVMLGLLQKCSLRWLMHPAMQYDLIRQAVYAKDYSIDVTDLTEEEKVASKELAPFEATLFGIPIRTREDFPKSWIRLYAGDKMLGQIDGCAIPAIFGGYNDWEKEQETEREKARILWKNTATEDLPHGVMRDARERE